MEQDKPIDTPNDHDETKKEGKDSELEDPSSSEIKLPPDLPSSYKMNYVEIFNFSHTLLNSIKMSVRLKSMERELQSQQDAFIKHYSHTKVHIESIEETLEGILECLNKVEGYREADRDRQERRKRRKYNDDVTGC